MKIVRLHCSTCNIAQPVTPTFNHGWLRSQQAYRLNCSICGEVIRRIERVELVNYGFDFFDLLREPPKKKTNDIYAHETDLFPETRVRSHKKKRKVSDYQMKMIRASYRKKALKKRASTPTLLELEGI